MNNQPTLNSPTILVAEDDDGHAELVIKNLRRAGIVNNIIRAVDGQETLDRILGQGTYEGQGPLEPLILLLDINMPKLSGPEVLKILKENPVTALIPVIVLTTTDNPIEIRRCYDLGCNVYIVKPVDYDAFIEAVKRLGLFLQVVAHP